MLVEIKTVYKMHGTYIKIYSIPLLKSSKPTATLSALLTNHSVSYEATLPKQPV